MKRREFLIAVAAAPFTMRLAHSFAGSKFDSANIKAIYLAADNLENKNKIDYLSHLINDTELNAIVIDVKDSAVFLEPRHLATIRSFRERGVYIIARIVTFQDSFLAKKWPDLAIRTKNGGFWRSGKLSWNRFWMDPASSAVAYYNIGIAKRAIDAGADEINFDYIRFPSDGNMRDIAYPVWDGIKPKYAALEIFFERLNRELKEYSPSTALSIDIFGYAFMNGSEPGIGQRLVGMAKYFNVISPMAYPSHYQCGEFNLRDPNSDPYVVYRRTLGPGLKFLKEIGFKEEIRPWIQDFSIANIYGCGSAVRYGRREVAAQIKALKELGIAGFMLWNAGNNYTKEALKQ